MSAVWSSSTSLGEASRGSPSGVPAITRSPVTPRAYHLRHREQGNLRRDAYHARRDGDPRATPWAAAPRPERSRSARRRPAGPAGARLPVQRVARVGRAAGGHRPGVLPADLAHLQPAGVLLRRDLLRQGRVVAPALRLRAAADRERRSPL